MCSEENVQYNKFNTPLKLSVAVIFLNRHNHISPAFLHFTEIMVTVMFLMFQAMTKRTFHTTDFLLKHALDDFNALNFQL